VMLAEAKFIEACNPSTDLHRFDEQMGGGSRAIDLHFRGAFTIDHTSVISLEQTHQPSEISIESKIHL